MHQRRRELGELSRHAILDAAARLMAERGYDATSIAVLSAETSLPSSSIYWHFGSKEGVLAAVLERGAERFFAECAELVDTGGGSDPSEEIIAAMGDLGRWLLAGGEHSRFVQLQLRFMMNREQLGDQARALVDQNRRSALDVLSHAIAHAYRTHGDVEARRIGVETAPFGMAVLDGVFLTASTHADASQQASLLRDAGYAIAAAAARVAAQLDAVTA